MTPCTLPTCRVVSEWGFKKDGVERSILDMTNDTKGSQLDDRDTFMAIGKNRFVSDFGWVWQASSCSMHCQTLRQ